MLGITFISLSTAVLAWNNPYDNNSNNSYKSYSGTSYQYDLSDPGDRVDYSVDVDAQMRDSISVDPTRSMDRDLGQYGGGIYDD